MKTNRMIAMVVALLLTGMTALAMPVRVDEGKMMLSCMKDDEIMTLSVSEFQLLGMGLEGKYLIYTDQGYFDLISMMQTLTDKETARLNRMSNTREADFSTLSRGDKGDAVRQLQSALSSLGYLIGSIDGDYGSMTVNAVNALQESLGMEQTGIADPRLQMLAISMTQPAFVLSYTTAIDSPLNDIAERAGFDLQELLSSGMQFDYDDIEGVGFITDGNTISQRYSGGSDLDQYTLKLQFGLYVRDTNGKTVSVEPTAKISCLCVRRPIIEEMTLKSGDYRETLAIEELSAVLNGITTEEKGIVKLDDQMVEALAQAAETGELKMRIKGRYKTFDISAGRDTLDSVAKIAALAKQLKD